MDNYREKAARRRLVWATAIFILLLVVGVIMIVVNQSSEGVIWAPGPIGSSPVPPAVKV